MAESVKHTSSGVSRSKRDLPPAHFSLKIQSYSLLAKTKVEKYNSSVFEAPGGHKWRLSLYPNEEKEENGYISLYLEIAETAAYPQGWEVYANFRLFVFDQLQKKYLTIQDADGAMNRFHLEKTKWGFEKLLSIEAFKNSSNGYLIDDCCEFGAEVFVYKRSSEWESLAMVKEPRNVTFSLTMKKLSELEDTIHFSDVFTVGERNWNLRVYLNGVDDKGKALSVFLEFADWKSLPADRAVFAQFKIWLLDQVHGEQFEQTTSQWFSSNTYTFWGFPAFMPLEDLHDESKGFIKNDTLTFKINILVMSVVKVYT